MFNTASDTIKTAHFACIINAVERLSDIMSYGSNKANVPHTREFSTMKCFAIMKQLEFILDTDGHNKNPNALLYVDVTLSAV